MNLAIGRIADILAAIVGVAALTVLFTSKYTAGILAAFFNGFSGSLRSAEGQAA